MVSTTGRTLARKRFFEVDYEEVLVVINVMSGYEIDQNPDIRSIELAC